MTDISAFLPIIYLSLFLAVLSSAAWFIVQQVLRTRRIEGKLNQLQAKLTQEKGSPQEYYELGSIYLDKKVFGQAITQFQKALKASDLTEAESPPIYNALGYAYFAQEQYDLAIRQYKEALKIQPEYSTALNNLGHTYEKKQLSSLALETYEQVLAIDRNNPTAKRRVESLKKLLAT